MAAVAVEERADRPPTQCGGDGGVQFACVQVVSPQRVAVGNDFQNGRRAEVVAVQLDRFRAANLLQNFSRLTRDALKLGEIVAVNLHRDVGTRAFEHFVEAHFDGLREEIINARHAGLERAREEFLEFVARDGAAIDLAPFLRRCEVEERVRKIRAHRVSPEWRLVKPNPCS